METTPILWRAFGGPSKHTFTIKPIAELLRRYVTNPSEWCDPFAGYNSPCWITNDLNPDAPTTHHMDAEEFIRSMPKVVNCLFDPPYSPRQISEAYRGIGREVTMKDTQNALLYARVRNAIAEKMDVGGKVVSFGWNTTGFGMSRGYEKIEIGMVNHGAAHNDTLVVVERKVR